MRIRSLRALTYFTFHVAGLLNFCGSFFQQWGITMTTASKSSFITGIYVILVPIMSWCFLQPKFNNNRNFNSGHGSRSRSPSATRPFVNSSTNSNNTNTNTANSITISSSGVPYLLPVGDGGVGDERVDGYKRAGGSSHLLGEEVGDGGLEVRSMVAVGISVLGLFCLSGMSWGNMSLGKSRK